MRKLILQSLEAALKIILGIVLFSLTNRLTYESVYAIVCSLMIVSAVNFVVNINDLRLF